jgi:hypothetical protein
MSTAILAPGGSMGMTRPMVKVSSSRPNSVITTCSSRFDKRRPDADQSTYQQVYQQLGFDKSLTTQFGIYFVNLLHNRQHRVDGHDAANGKGQQQQAEQCNHHLQ